MSHELLGLYQKIQETPALTLDLPPESGQGHVTRLDTGSFSLSSWNMEFHKDMIVEGKVKRDLRLLFCSGEGVEWSAGNNSMRLDHNEACFCLSDGSTERMCYQSNAAFSFLSVSIPTDRFFEMISGYLPETDRIINFLPGKRFTIPSTVQRKLHEIGPLESVHNGFEMMRLDARLLESVSLCLETILSEPAPKQPLHHDDFQTIRAIGQRIEENPANIPDIATLAREYCMSVSKLTRAFRRVYGVSLHACVIETRLQKGAELLTCEDRSIQQIAEIVGYSKPGKFSADFRKRFGVLPSEYRLR